MGEGGFINGGDGTWADFGLAALALLCYLAVVCRREIQRSARQAFQRASELDPLTGLPNRAALSREIERREAMILSGETARLAVLTIDLNRFKEINDVYGHRQADTLLQRVAAQLREALGSEAFVARSGGDEFMVLTARFTETAQVERLADRLLRAIDAPITLDGVEHRLGASIGLAAYPEHGGAVQDILQRSDLALQRAKARLLEAACVFDAEADALSHEKTALTNDLRQALALDQFELHYQPQNDVRTREIVGFEALLRWRHPTLGSVPPDDFIPLAEKSGLIRSIGEWVLRVACREAARWRRPLRIAVNVAPQQLAAPGFVALVEDALRESGLDPRRLELEITEASLIDDQEHTLAVMRRLKSMGIRIAMDDFGTGYASLASLRAFPFDKIKIDRSFIESVDRNEQNAAIVKSTLLLGEALRIPVLAEGVETEEQLSFLGEVSCLEAQGFLFGRPAAAEDSAAPRDEPAAPETTPEPETEPLAAARGSSEPSQA